MSDLTSNLCACPNGSYGRKHTTECYERQILRLTDKLLEARRSPEAIAFQSSHDFPPPWHGKRVYIIPVDLQDCPVAAVESALMRAGITYWVDNPAPPPGDEPDPVVRAQHEDTGRMWEGPRTEIPPRYFECQPVKQPHEPPGWQSIETAPKDGTCIMVSGGIAYWRERSDYAYSVEGWHTITGCDWPGKPIQWEVTHWMPIPSAPVTKGGGL